jgi:DNA-binding NtrC family response regulator
MIRGVLIVDDIQRNRELIREGLNSSEFRFTEAQNAWEALQIMRRKAADLVITDMKMPGLSGVDLIKDLRKECPNSVVILVTSFGTIGSAVEAYLCCDRLSRELLRNAETLAPLH